MKVLLVDDDEFLVDMYATKFTESGHTVDTATSIESALDKLSKQKDFDVVLLDMVMPGMTGAELVKKICSDGLGGSPKCIMLSNQSEEQDIQAAISAGASGYIVKATMIPSEVVAKVTELAG